jgi:hypothetical protein
VFLFCVQDDAIDLFGVQQVEVSLFFARLAVGVAQDHVVTQGSGGGFDAAADLGEEENITLAFKTP